VIFGYYAQFVYVPFYASFIGLSDATGALMVGLMSGFNAIGRIAIGAMADRLGCINSTFICTLISAICSLLIWPFVKSYSGMLVFVILDGFLQAVL